MLPMNIWFVVFNNAMCLQWTCSALGVVTFPIAFEETAYCFSYAIPSQSGTQGIRIDAITLTSFQTSRIGQYTPSYAWVMIIGK